MPAAKHNITVEQGATFIRTITIKDSASEPIDITGWTLRGKIRESQSAETAIATFVTEILDQTDEDTIGQATFSLSAAVTAAIPEAEFTKPFLKTTKLLYDLEIEKPSGEVIRLLQGDVTFVPEMTK